MRQHVVTAGETISSIARDILGNVSLWPSILAVNPQLPAPSGPNQFVLIVPGQRINLPDAPSPAVIPSRPQQPPGDSQTVLIIGSLAVLGIFLIFGKKKRGKRK